MLSTFHRTSPRIMHACIPPASSLPFSCAAVRRSTPSVMASSTPCSLSTSPERLCASLQALVSSLSCSSRQPPLLAAVAQLSPLDASSLCAVEQLQPLVALLLALDERQLTTQPALQQPELAGDAALDSPALRSTRSAISRLSSLVDDLTSQRQSARHSIAAHHAQLIALTSTLASAQASLDASATSAAACFPSLLSSDVGEWGEELLSAFAAEEADLDEELLFWTRADALQPGHESEVEEWEEEDVQAEVEQRAHELQMSHRLEIHSRLELAAAQARLQLLQAAAATSATQPLLEGDGELQSAATSPAQPPPLLSSPHSLTPVLVVRSPLLSAVVRRCPPSWTWPPVSVVCTPRSRRQLSTASLSSAPRWPWPRSSCGMQQSRCGMYSHHPSPSLLRYHPLLTLTRGAALWSVAVVSVCGWSVKWPSHSRRSSGCSAQWIRRLR